MNNEQRETVKAQAIEWINDRRYSVYDHRGGRDEVVPGFLAADLILWFCGPKSLDDADIQIEYRKLVLELLQNYEEKRFKMI